MALIFMPVLLFSQNEIRNSLCRYLIILHFKALLFIRIGSGIFCSLLLV